MASLQIHRSQPSSEVPLSNPSPPRSCNHRVSHFMLFLVVLFLLVCCAIAIAWTIINPQDPTFRLISFSASNITLSKSRLNAEYDMEFNVNNTNKKANLVIDNVKVVVSYGKATVTKGVLKDMIVYVPKMSHQKLNVKLGRDLAQSIKNKVFKDISDDWCKKIMNFNMELSFGVKYELGVWPSKNKYFHASCIGLTVEFFSTKGTGKFMGAGTDCLVHLN